MRGLRGLGPLRWNWLAPAAVLLMMYGLTEQLHYILGTTKVAVRPNWAALIGVSLTFAVINAANEEFRFRFVLVARRQRAVGARATLWMTSLNFGLAHYWSGHPSGPTGVLTTALFGMLLVRSLYDTEGGLWAWLMHIAGDVVIMAIVLLRVG